MGDSRPNGQLNSPFQAHPLIVYIALDFTGELAEPRKKPVLKRAAKDRHHVRNLLRTWRASTLASHVNRAVLQPTWLIDDADIKALASRHPSVIQSPIDIKNALQETDAWYHEYASAIFDVIHIYDHPIILFDPEPA